MWLCQIKGERTDFDVYEDRFPYLFYASSFVAEIHAAEKHGGVRILQSESDKDTERGSAALL